MSKLNRKGFTLIELLAVITIMGILMVVAIPSVSRTIENSRRDTFLDTAKQYTNAVKTLWTSDGLECPESNGAIAAGNPAYLSSALNVGDYYVLIDSSKAEGSDVLYPTLLESGGKSSWGQKNVKGFVKINVANAAGAVAGSTNNGRKITYTVVLTDGVHGIKDNSKDFQTLKRSDVVTTGATYPTLPEVASAKICEEA